MKKDYIAPKTIFCEDTEVFCSLEANSKYADDQDSAARGRKDDWDEEDLW